MDVFTRQIVRIAILTRHTASLVVQALVSALLYNPHPLMIHMDKESEYTSKEFTTLCTASGIIASCSDTASPRQNAFQESFYDKFKIDLIERLFKKGVPFNPRAGSEKLRNYLVSPPSSDHLWGTHYSTQRFRISYPDVQQRHTGSV